MNTMESDSAVVDEKPETGAGEGVPEARAELAPALAPGEILRQAREARGESLGDAVQALKLSYQQLEALESGKFDVLPGPTFVRGFLRNYAHHLGLDPGPLLAGLGGQISRPVDLILVSSGGGANIPAPMVSAPARRGMFPVLLAVLALAVAVAVAGFSQGWFEMPHGLGSNAPSVGKDDVVTQELPALVVSPGESQVQVAEALPVVVETLPAAGNTSAQTAAPVGNAPPAPPAEAASAISTLRFTFSVNAWVQVREGSEGSGKLLFVGTGSAGSSRNIRGTPPFSLVVAKANKVALEYNGKSVDLMSHVANDGIARLTLQ
ncbi:MAG: DUF4115 domain-containing protein [Azoarcus sp.]|jgi:cytoskeleton protein RodZ|nr:DUF4115 domain-containing protein [Azoarcus sp.]